MTKKTTESFLELIVNQLKTLRDDQYEKLLKGEATFQYIEIVSEDSESETKNEENDVFDDLTNTIQSEANDLQSIQKLLSKFTKKELSIFCEHLNIQLVSRDTKASIYKKVASYFNISSDEEKSKKEPKNEFETIGEQLKTIQEFQTAKEFLSNHEQLQTKAKLVKLAKTMNVHITTRLTKAQVFTRILESTVGSKLRAKGIREK